jgi:hypothetical protein
LKESLQAIAEENQVKIKERKVKVEMAEFELAKKRSRDTGSKV